MQQKSFIAEERILKALADKRRLRILAYLKKNKQAVVSDIADHIQLSLKATSKHLAVLYSANVLEKVQKDKYVYYHLPTDLHPVIKYVLDVK